jgi:hypothetical protein
MFLFRPLAILSVLLIGGGSSAWASGVAFGNNASLSLYGFTFQVSGCSLEISGTSESSCSGHNLELESVSTGRDTITIEVAPTSGSYALQSTNGALTSLSYTLTATRQTGNTVFSAATLTTTGSNTYSCQTWGCSTTVSAAVSSGGSTMLSAALAQNQTTNSSTYTLTSPVSAFSVQENVTLDGSGLANGSVLALSTVAMRLNTTPEPASVAILLVGLGSLAVARRRRRRG